MITWDDIQFSTEKAQQEFEKLQIDNISDVEIAEKYKSLRGALIKKRDLVFDKYEFDESEKLGYDFDLTFGLELYETLNEEFKLSLRNVASDDIWRFLQFRIIPDVVFSRWNLNKDRYYKNKSRIWLKTLWWYINLSWNETKENTFNLLKDNTTDTIMQLVERPGLGYNVPLFREIMRQYCNYNDGTNNSRLIFRRVLILNTARLAVMSPELSKNKIEGYVKALYEDVSKEQVKINDILC